MTWWQVILLVPVGVLGGLGLGYILGRTIYGPGGR